MKQLVNPIKAANLLRKIKRLEKLKAKKEKIQRLIDAFVVCGGEIKKALK